MSNSARKRRTARDMARLGTKRFRQAERRAIRGDKARGRHYSYRWGNIGSLRDSNIPASGHDSE